MFPDWEKHYRKPTNRYPEGEWVQAMSIGEGEVAVALFDLKYLQKMPRGEVLRHWNGLDSSQRYYSPERSHCASFGRNGVWTTHLTTQKMQKYSGFGCADGAGDWSPFLLLDETKPQHLSTLVTMRAQHHVIWTVTETQQQEASCV